MNNRQLVFRKAKPSEDVVQWLYNELEEAYLSEVGQPKVTKKETFSPSSIGYGHGKCPRYWYLAFEGKYVFTQKTDARGMANMMNGTKTHERLQELLLKRGTIKETEIEIKIESPPIRGYIDGKIVLPSGEEIVIFEIKSAFSTAWEYRRGSGKPSDQHLLQLLIYLKATGAKRGVFLYENKDTQEPLFLLVDLTADNDRLIEGVFEWLREVRKAWEDQTLVARPTKRKDAVICKTCPLYAPCWNEVEDGELKIKPMEVKLLDK